MQSYWYKTCPFCHGQGILLLCIDEHMHQPFFSCDECLLAWSETRHIGTSQDIFNAYNRQHHLASWQEITHHDWQQYALHTDQKNIMTQEEYAVWKKSSAYTSQSYRWRNKKDPLK